jgi:hypothetical protein
MVHSDHRDGTRNLKLNVKTQADQHDKRPQEARQAKIASWTELAIIGSHLTL